MSLSLFSIRKVLKVLPLFRQKNMSVNGGRDSAEIGVFLL